VDDAGVDAARFEGFVADAREAAATGRHDDAARLLREGLRLWRGPTQHGSRSRTVRSPTTRSSPSWRRPGAAEFLAPNVPVHLGDRGFVDHRFLESALLERLTMPILLLHGSRTQPFYRSAVHHLSSRLPDASAREIAGAGHMGPLLAPAAVNEELTAFFAPASTRA
jgi:pimeloyl-ACP methyl ester carboxylesterase